MKDEPINIKVKPDVADFIRGNSTATSDGWFHISQCFKETDDPLVFEFQTFTKSPYLIKKAVAEQLHMLVGLVNTDFKVYEEDSK